jgi:prepilin-type N-terminal cleavage/methylation domain-containing protein
MTRSSLRAQAGFSLAEMLVATAIAAFGLAGIAALIGTGVQLQGNARASTIGVNLAVAEFERLRALPITSAERAVGGSLTANAASHFAIRGTTTVRWTVANGPACGQPAWAPTVVSCAREVTVVAIPQSPLAAPSRVTGALWR